jgi:sec-independent protein translocase protein TatA
MATVPAAKVLGGAKAALGWLTPISSHRWDADRTTSRRDGRRYLLDAEEALPVDDKYLIVILVLAILFGASRLPMLGRNFGQGIREFKKGIAQNTQDEPAAAPPMPPDDDRGATS